MSPTITLALLLGYFAILMAVSLGQKEKTGGNESFFRGTRRSPWPVVAIGMVGASLSGVTFVSVPGMVRGNDMLYMQTVMGFFVGYILIAEILLPVYFKLDSPSIYTYLSRRLGPRSYKTGAAFFLISKTIGAAARLYVVVIILQYFILDQWNVPFVATAAAILLMIWLYTRHTGIKTIVWTDLFQTICLLGAMTLLIVEACRSLGLGLADACSTLAGDSHFRWFEFSDWSSKQHFVKQFFSGIFIALVMTGLDQDMMQKNLSINSLRDAKRNIYTYGFAFLPVNFLFMCLGILLLVFASRNGIALPEAGDDILPMLATGGHLGKTACLLFVVGIVSASFSSADSALTALTTSFCVDLMGRPEDLKLRRRAHVAVTLLILAIMLALKAFNNSSLLDAIYVIASYTYGPLLGMFAFGLTTRRPVDDRLTPFIAVASPLVCAAIQAASTRWLHYSFGYELLMLNGLLTYLALWLGGSKRRVSRSSQTIRPATTKKRSGPQAAQRMESLSHECSVQHIRTSSET